MKLVLITGASSGVGAASARKFLADGAKVILVARGADALTALANELGKNAITMPCDAADAEQVKQLSASVLETYGVPDVIVNSAGAGQWKTVEDTPPSEAITMMQAPYFAAFNVTHSFLPALKDRNSGVIIHVNSPASVFQWPSSAGYAASRAALKALHGALFQDLAGSGVHSCHIIFGKISSEYFVNNPGVEEHLPLLDKTIPTLSPEYCATRIAALADNPRQSKIYPFILKMYVMFSAIFPGITRWLLRF